MPDETMQLLRNLFSTDEDMPIAQRADMFMSLSQISPEVASRASRLMFEHIAGLRKGLKEAMASQEELKEILDQLTEAPWLPAAFVRAEQTGEGLRARVRRGNVESLVSFEPDVDVETLRRGEEVYLSKEQNAILGISPLGPPTVGETAKFVGWNGDTQLVLEYRNEIIVIDAAASLEGAALKEGDLIRLDRAACMGYSVVDRPNAATAFIEDTPTDTFDDVGGLDAAIEEIKEAIELFTDDAEEVAKSGCEPVSSILLIGAPGNGKNLLVRATANFLAQLSESGQCRFIDVKPGQLKSMWHGETEANIRRLFSRAREAAADDTSIPVIVFLDEIDSVGAVRGQSLSRVSDQTNQALYAELDGTERRRNILVIGATNRPDALDPAMLRPGRMGDMVIHIDRPDARGARSILGKHLPADIIYACEDGQGDAAAAREMILDGAVEAIFAPNGETELAVATFRDGKRRVVYASDLINGAMLANIIRGACRRARRRNKAIDQEGLRADDVLTVLADELQKIVSILKPWNIRAHVSGMPADHDIVRVEPLKRKVNLPHRYVNLHVARPTERIEA